VIQRVDRAVVRVDGRTLGKIGRGLLILVGFAAGDDTDKVRWMTEKVCGLRVFRDADGRMNLDVREAGGELLVVSQFTLYGDVTRGRRPSFVGAAPTEEARALYGEFLDLLRGGVVPVASGEFGARMEVELVNEGPVTLVIER
jgi:D-tyrosyl-tRNA(Tyr) deacylase